MKRPNETPKFSFGAQNEYHKGIKRDKWIKQYYKSLIDKGVELNEEAVSVLDYVINYTFTINSIAKIRIINKNIKNLNKRNIGFVYFWEGLLLMIKDPYEFIVSHNINMDNVYQIIDSVKLMFTIDGMHSVMDETIEIISGLYEFYLLDTFGS